MKRIAFSLLSLLIVSACTNKSPSIFQNPGARAKSSIGESFAVQPVKADPAQLNVDKAKITIQKSALEKEFLIQSQLVIQPQLPTFGGLQSRIVFFRQVENKVYMIEASKGLLLPKDYPNTLPLAEFEVTAETATDITFDFNKGMSRLFIAGDWHSRDSMEGDTYTSARPAFSYISLARTTANNQLEIRQMALIELPSKGVNNNLPVEVIYYLTPYAPNPNFTPTVATSNYERMGFFEVASQFNGDGGVTTFASKMDISKPVVYAISSNTPAEFKEAVREGILYWNKAFGREVIQVVDAPAGVTAPNPDYNVVQWVEVDMAGFAFADSQMDPRTGEILHQQIFFSSGWRRVARGEIADYLKSGRVARKAPVSLAGFQSNSLCNMDLNAQVAGELGKIASTEKDQAKILKASADLLREVVAHEVGHTLGLRHNFAGSVAANYPVEKREELFKAYMESGSAPADLVTSSTVMDYQYPVESAMHGDQMKNLPKASAYDEKAIRALYLGEKFKASELPLFCTDSHVGYYADCKPYDAGNSFVDWIKYSSKHQIDNMPYRLFNAYVAAKAPSFGGVPRDVEEVASDPKFASLMALSGMSDMVGMIRKDGRLLAVDRKYPFVSGANQEAVRRETVELVTAALNRHGQFEGVMVATKPALIEGMIAKFEAILQDPKMIRGTTADGKAYEFSAEELRIMKENGRLFFNQMRLELAKTEVQILNGENPIYALIKELFGVDLAAGTVAAPFDINDLSQMFSGYVEKRAEDIVLSTTGEPSVYKKTIASDWGSPSGGKTGESQAPAVTTITLAKFTYPLEVRKSAAGMLRADRAESPVWGYAERLVLSAAYETVISAALPGVTEKDSGTIEKYPFEVTRWILESREVRAAINKP